MLHKKDDYPVPRHIINSTIFSLPRVNGSFLEVSKCTDQKTSIFDSGNIIILLGLWEFVKCVYLRCT